MTKNCCLMQKRTSTYKTKQLAVEGGVTMIGRWGYHKSVGGGIMHRCLHSDENIAKKKDKTLSKHYTILVNGNKQKILNYKIRPALNDNNVRILELISKFKFAANLNTDKTISVVIDKGEKLNLEGTLSFAAIAIGNYSLGNYSVPKVAIKCKAFKTLFPDLMVVSITDLKMANTFALSRVLN